MNTINLATVNRSNKLIEQQLMLAVRFGVLMYRRRDTELSRRRLLAAIKALHDHLNTYGPSTWLEQNFMGVSGQFAGLWWLVTGKFGSYRIGIDDREFKVAGAPVLSLVKGEMQA
ncbi:hypothetical protein JYB87_12010 [Shewanella avicenniae]|uniref:Uncharacterized protein n=1 Tax=Shewanella avicenniae TaxID=2814294 RepID=A0ABX7QNM2_9GAMM|nr:hypothetical protein [Shewanella avicenniae]QSX32490.1 hypothetical protein JYB87_12010 [Shewanella avicenniae]